MTVSSGCRSPNAVSPLPQQNLIFAMAEINIESSMTDGVGMTGLQLPCLILNHPERLGLFVLLLFF
jgi:hypothetical protein